MRSRPALFPAVVTLLAFVIGTTRAARSDPPEEPRGAEPQAHKARWDPEWSHSNAWDYALAGVGAGTLVFEGLVLQPEHPPLRWTSPILFDVAVRDVLRAPSATTRNALEGVAWSLWGLQLAYPVLVDVSFAWNRYGYDLARDLFWQDAVTLTLAGAVDLALRDLAGRARPPVYDCLVAGGNSCLAGQDSTRSFPGGHMVNSTAASVLTCTQHLYVQLYGGAWDTLVCATTLASDAAIGVLRIVSDNHWASDQIAGAALGAAMGWGVPYVMHFRGRARASATGASRGGAHDVLVLPVPLALDHGAGVAVSGLF